MNKQHKWHKEIKAWADGAEIEGRIDDDDEFSEWETIAVPNWDVKHWKYRIKPQPKEPQYLHVYQDVSINANNYLLRTSFIEEPNVAIYIGKIKLEVDD